MDAQKNITASDLIAPSNMGRMNDPDVAAQVTGQCGDSMEMYLVIKDEIVTDSRFFTDGCNVSRICGSAAARLAKDKSLKEILRLSPADVIDSLKELPDNNIHCAILAVATLHKALADFLLRSLNG
ncbi:MAG: iron-sulfur cluster assembly scaffold protein [Fibrobacterota bacterium]